MSRRLPGACWPMSQSVASLDWAAQALGVERMHVARWVACLVGLHDFGKAIPGFQDKWFEG
ncbi:HD domain-containing protein [Phytopseudomonas daroniae]|uniref:HD domain-containing protein n=1 Tax=Pseudomonadaceae TaxID=135621 RepID=UPI0034DAFCFF